MRHARAILAHLRLKPCDVGKEGLCIIGHVHCEPQVVDVDRVCAFRTGDEEVECGDIGDIDGGSDLADGDLDRQRLLRRHREDLGVTGPGSSGDMELDLRGQVAGVERGEAEQFEGREVASGQSLAEVGNDRRPLLLACGPLVVGYRRRGFPLDAPGIR